MSVRNNDYITYNIATHRYTLTEAYMQEYYGISLISVLDSTGDIQPETLPKRWLNQVSLTIYNYIYKYADNKKVTEYKLANESEWIDCLQEAMGQLAYSMLLLNTNIGLFNGIDLGEGKKIERIDIAQGVVPVQVEEILRNGNLLYRGTFSGFDYALLDDRGVTY